MARKQDEAGFSLIEVMVVIAIVTILMAIGTPNYLNWRVKKQLSGAVTGLKADLELAKARAIHKSTHVTVLFEAKRYRIFTDSAANWIQDGNDDRVVERPLAEGVTITIPTGLDNDRVMFNSRGLVSDDGLVRFVNNSGSGRINISLIGVITVNDITYN